MRLRPGVVALLLLGGALFPGVWITQARAEYQACNETSYILEMAVASLSELGAISQGWFEITPGSCRTVLRSDLHSELELFAFARSADIYGAQGITYHGDTPFCISDEDFLIEGVGLCQMRDYQHARFAGINFEGEKWTTYFSEETNYDLKRAAIAGAQRLLSRLGYSIGSVDGLVGSRTRLALDAFRKEKEVENDTEKIFAALFETVKAKRFDAGLEVCNQSEYRVWAAVGIEEEKGDVIQTRGWLPMDAGKCSPMLLEPLDAYAYYFFAEAVDEEGFTVQVNDRRLSWGGAHLFCVSAIRFVIDGQDSCDARNYDQRGFYRLNTDGEPHYTLTLPGP
ncbi:MAG: DUF1036 domain-containing protein [Hyphomicrobiales bacterium]|nr:DUF1036 domain-containing protein [Hyphomicrobiales bacterium]MCY4033952.1 DUF1036 domain-containing protein [Hyphomicrobiales bacterium]